MSLSFQHHSLKNSSREEAVEEAGEGGKEEEVRGRRKVSTVGKDSSSPKCSSPSPGCEIGRSACGGAPCSSHQPASQLDDPGSSDRAPPPLQLHTRLPN